MADYQNDHATAETIGEFDSQQVLRDGEPEDAAWKQTYYQHALAGFDRSDSMNEGNKIGELNDAIPKLLTPLADPQCNESLYVSTLSFNHEVTVDHRYQLAKDINIRSFRADGGTNINNVLEAATEVDAEFRESMSGDGRLPLKPVLFIFTDGETHVDDHLLMITKERFNIIPIGFGRDADRAMLRKLSSDGTFITADTAPGRLSEVFAKVGQAVSDGFQTAI